MLCKSRRGALRRDWKEPVSRRGRYLQKRFASTHLFKPRNHSALSLADVRQQWLDDLIRYSERRLLTTIKKMLNSMIDRPEYYQHFGVLQTIDAGTDAKKEDACE